MPEALTDQTVKAVYDKTTTDKINALLPEEDKSYKKGTYYGRDTDKKNIVRVDINKDGVSCAVSVVKGDDKHKEECKKLADGSLTADKLDDGSFKEAEGNALVSGTAYKVKLAKGRTNVGKYSVKVTLAGKKYTGSKTLTFTIAPRRTSISKVSGVSKGFTVKWSKRTTQTTGYQVQYATNKSFHKAKLATVKSNKITSATVKKLSADKKYYVRIRTYKTVDGKKYNSDWSTAKTVNTKK